ncbi:MAG: SRPBCC family protein [Roseobacter sp.]
MKFSNQVNVDAPIETVFEALVEFETYEKAAAKRGVKTQRSERTPKDPLGTKWDVLFSLKGKPSQVGLEIAECVAPTRLGINLDSRNLTGKIVCDLTSVSQSRTHLKVTAEIRPLTFPARLLVQSFKLTKKRLDSRFEDALSEFASRAEKKPQRGA